MRNRISVLALLLLGAGAKAEPTPLEKLCASYDHKTAVLEHRLRIGARPGERVRIHQQLDLIATDKAKLCKSEPAAAPAALKPGPAKTVAP